jgi:ABC-2 type transport system permease protein
VTAVVAGARRAPDGTIPASPRSRLRAYRSLARASRRGVLSFGLSFWLGQLANILLLLTTLYLWRAILLHANHMKGWTWPEMRGYLAATFVAGSLVGFSSDLRMAFRIQDGTVAIDLSKPVDYQLARLAETLGLALLELATGLLIAFAVTTSFGGVAWPPALDLALFLLSLAAVVPLKWAVTYIGTLACFWTHNYLGVTWARQAITALLSGAMIPLALLPVWIRLPADVLPFQGMASTPGLIFSGRLHGWPLSQALALQYGWVIAAFWGSRWLWARASRQLTVHGG